jgi:NADH:ubiquinone oxidoreductase subunit 3 (subunit A)
LYYLIEVIFLYPMAILGIRDGMVKMVIFMVLLFGGFSTSSKALEWE